MRKWIIAFLLAVPVTAYSDTIFLLENGSIRRVHGTIIGEVPGESVSIRTHKGQELIFSAENIVNVLREDARPVLPNNPSFSSMRNRSYREPSTAFLFSFLIPGGGQFYNGEPGKGFVQLAGVTAGLIMYVANLPRYNGFRFGTTSGNATLSALGISTAVTLSLWSLFDAPASARKLNRKRGLAKLQPVFDELGLGLATRWSF